jgi:acyl carrier protein
MSPAVPLSARQLRLWESGDVRNSPPHAVAVDVDGPLDPATLEHAFHRLADRHNALRTTIGVVAGAPQLRTAATAVVAVRHVDLYDVPEQDRLSAVVELLVRLARPALDPDEDVPVRLTLLRVEPDWHVVLLTAHRLVVDARSLDVLTEELWQEYGDLAGTTAATAGPPSANPSPMAEEPPGPANADQGAEREADRVDRHRAHPAPEPLSGPPDSVTLSTASAEVPASVAARVRAATDAGGGSAFDIVVAAVAELLRSAASAGAALVQTIRPDRPSPALKRAVGVFEEVLPAGIGPIAGTGPGARGSAPTTDVRAVEAAGQAPTGGDGATVLVRHQTWLRLPPVANLSLTALDLGRARGRHFLEFTFVEGEATQSLAIGWDEERLPAVEARRMLDGLLEALKEWTGLYAPVSRSPHTPEVPAASTASTATAGLEVLIAAIWSEELDLEVTDFEADFYDLGGNSFQGATVVGRLRKTLGVDIPLQHIFHQPATVAGLARIIERLAS